MDKIIVYSTETCPFCKKTKDYLKSRGVNFDDIDVALERERLEEMIEKSGQMGVPVIDINGKVIVGFDQKEIDKQLEKGKR
ncbi:MAG: glutaredoxin family protein [Actinomycetota bacterium]